MADAFNDSVSDDVTEKEPIVKVSIPPVLLTTNAALFCNVPGVTFKRATSLPPAIFITTLASELAPMNRLLEVNEYASSPFAKLTGASLA